jgi:hypothetical protein
MQDTKSLPSPIGVVYNTSMARADAALALAALYVTASRRQARVNGVSVNGSGLGAAIFCDVVARFYSGSARAPSSNAVLPVGFDAEAKAADPVMVERAVTRTRPNGQPQYARTIQRLSDTATPDALLRNAITLTTETVVVLSAPATWLAKSIALAGTAGQYERRVKRVVIVEAGDSDRDPGALKPVTELAVPIVFCGREVGESLRVPASRFDNAFAWAPAHPVADAVAASAASEVPLHDLAAMYFALHPETPFFTITDRRLAVAPGTAEACVTELLGLATSRPAPPPARTA